MLISAIVQGSDEVIQRSHWEFWAGVVSGVISAVIVLCIQWILTWAKNRRTFGPMKGEYDEIKWPGKVKTGAKIRIRVRGTTLTTEGLNEEGYAEWRGVINMNTLNPNVGEGNYLYVHKPDCGTHTVQRIPETKNFLVRGMNTSDPAGIEFNIMWRAHEK